ncbi:MAG: DUF4825 domain-containing protein [Clostridia bacterium]|nr:DUF4825 domain-containing protein [Clostridia bacterium]
MLSNLFVTLLRINVMATIVAVIVLTLKYILKKCGASRKLLFSLWIIIALRFVCPNFIESNFSLFNVFDNPIIEENQIAINNQTNNFIPNDIDFNTDNAIIDNSVVNTKINEIQTIIPSESIVKEQSNKLEITEILMLVWIAGSSGMILYALLSYFKLKKTVRFAVKGDGNYYETDMISTPCVLGIIKPKIYLTLNLTENEKKYILTHENTHIKRKDYFTKLIAYTILAIHWVNPISWVLFKMFVNDLEMLCDEESLKKLGEKNKVGYMESLVNLASKNRNNILPCPIAFSENNTEKRVKNMIKYKNSGIIISVVALIVCIIIAAICLTNKNKHEITNLAEDIYTYNNALLGDAPKMRSLVSLIPFYNKDIYISTIELDTETSTTKEMGIIVNIDNLTSEEITEMNDVIKHSKIFLSLVKNADFIQYNYISNEKNSSLQIPRMYFNEDLGVYTESYETFKNFIENKENTLNTRNEKVDLEEWSNIQEKVIYGELIYNEFNSNITYTDILTEQSKLQELNDYLFIYTKAIKGGTACPFTATLILRTEKGKEIEIQLATDSCTVFKIGEQYYEYTEDKGEDDSDEAGFYKYFDKINAYVNGEPIRSTLYNKIMGYNAYYKDTIEPTFITRNYYTKINNVEYCIAESFGFGKERDDISLDFDGDGIEELICNCTYGGDGHQEVYIFKRNMNTNMEIPSILIGKIDSKKVKLPELHDWGVNAILTGYDKATNRFWINYSKGNEIKNEYSTVYLDLNDAMNIFTFEEFNSITSKTKGFENNSITSTVYIDAIKSLYYNCKLPDGTELEDPKYVDDYNMSENQFAICDVDMDGKEELLIALTHYPMAAMRTIIYDYDSNTNKFREQFTGFNWMNFYNNGSLEVMWSHNQGSAGDSLWPYTLYKYNKELDSYDAIAEVDAWDKSFSEKSYIAETFPTEVDKDNDGVLYYIIPGGNYERAQIVDSKEYNEWKEQYIIDEIFEIIVPYMNLTEENIKNI